MKQTPMMRLSLGEGVLTRLQLNGPARLCMFWSSSVPRIKDIVTVSKESVGHGLSMIQTFNNNLKELGVVESKRNTIRRGFVHELMNAQDAVLGSYFAQRMGTKSDGWDRKGNGEENFQGLERFE